MTRESIFYGVRACEALAAARPDEVHRAFFSESTAPFFGPLMKSLAARRRPYRVVSEEELDKVSGARHHEGVCLVADAIGDANAADLFDALEADEPARWAYLDGVANPHNVGAVLRIAAHFGRSAVLGHRRDLKSPSGATARVSEGGAERVPVARFHDPGLGLSELRNRGFVLVATVVEHGRNLFDCELPPRAVFLIGAEADGLGQPALDIADIGVTIPGTGGVESLNVASATAILFAEHARRFRD